MKRIIITAAAVVVLVAAGVLAVRLRATSNGVLPNTYAQARSSGRGAPKACLSANKNITLDDTARADLEMAVIGQLIDVPAGTNVDVNVATYDASAATGSEIYGKDFGTYNFTVRKDNAGDWRVTSLVPCSK